MKKNLSMKPVWTAGLQGFPSVLSNVAEARRVVETVRLPAIRSQVSWLDACKRLLEAEASGSAALVEVARQSLMSAVTGERTMRDAPIRLAA